MCLQAWKIFSRLLPVEHDEKPLGLYKFRHHICHPTDRLEVYLQPMTSPSVEFVSHLVISGGCEASTSDLICLAQMPNLGVLELIQPADDFRSPFPEVNDRLLRGWAECDDPFRLLRVLRIWGTQDVTQDSLRWVSKFPSLALYDIVGCRDDWRSPLLSAEEHGWDLAKVTAGTEDSLMRYLLALAPGEQSGGQSKQLARTVNADLASLCSDTQCAVKFVAEGQAPALLDYLTDTAKVYTPSWDLDASLRGAGSCATKPFDVWSFWLYAFIGQLCGDSDLKACGIPADTKAVVGPFALPTRPVASLFLGHSGRGGIPARPAYVSRGLFAIKQMSFTRNATRAGNEVPKAREAQMDKKAVRQNGALRQRKRQRIDDILDSFTQ